MGRSSRKQSLGLENFRGKFVLRYYLYGKCCRCFRFLSSGSNGLRCYILKLLSSKCMCIRNLQSEPYNCNVLCCLPSQQNLLRRGRSKLSLSLLRLFRLLDLQTDWSELQSWLSNNSLRNKYYVLESDKSVYCYQLPVIYRYCNQPAMSGRILE